MSSAMQLRVKTMALSKNGRRWVEFVVEMENYRGWLVWRTFRDLEECRGFLTEQLDAALAAQGQDFPGVTCTCKKCAPGGGDLTGKCETVCKDKTVFSKNSEPNDYCKKAKTVSSSWLQAAMIIADLDAQTLAEASGVPQPDIVKIMETNQLLEMDDETISKLIRALDVKGRVEITEDGVRLIQKPLK